MRFDPPLPPLFGGEGGKSHKNRQKSSKFRKNSLGLVKISQKRDVICCRTPKNFKNCSKIPQKPPENLILDPFSTFAKTFWGRENFPKKRSYWLRGPQKTWKISQKTWKIRFWGGYPPFLGGGTPPPPPPPPKKGQFWVNFPPIVTKNLRQKMGKKCKFSAGINQKMTKKWQKNANFPPVWTKIYEKMQKNVKKTQFWGQFSAGMSQIFCFYVFIKLYFIKNFHFFRFA